VIAAYEGALAEVRADLRLLKWMVSANTALVLIVLGKLFFS
jgi:hypothetical protein